MNFAHEGHMGIGKTKQRARLYYWWPTLNKDVEQLVRQCHCCVSIPFRESPVQVTDFPSFPWQHLSIDIAGPKTDANDQQFYILAIIDNHSKWVHAEISYRPYNSKMIMQFLDSIFSLFRYCARLTTDNGVQFISFKFKNYLRQASIVHSKSAMYNPQSNGSIERMNRNFKKYLSNIQITKQCSYSKLTTYLRNYNNTPHDTTGVSPTSLMFRFNPRNHLEPIPLQRNSTSGDNNNQLVRRVQNLKRKRDAYANERRRPHENVRFRTGDRVKTKKGLTRTLTSQIGDFTFRMNDGKSSNVRNLRSAKKNEAEDGFVLVRPPDRRYPVRERRQPDRFCPRGGKM